MSEAMKRQLIFYGSYHSDAMNKLIHAVCVPLLLWTGMAMLAPLHVTTVAICETTSVQVSVERTLVEIYHLQYNDQGW